MTGNINIFVWSTIICWTLFAACWLLLRNETKENVSTRTFRQRNMGFLGYLIIFSLLYLPFFVTNRFVFRIIPPYAALQSVGALLCAAGVGICIWSRIVLGWNWSGGVTAKKDHELVIKGPYRLVRHPIYTGFICAVAGTCLVTGSLPGIVISCVYTLGLCMKISDEEILLSNVFPDSYATYQQHTRKLIPFIW
ncbi:protein-S-isoprenylcysteine O-methyltransferase [Chitinophaga niastensis]|uniref:Protein-S-isoprenylcysteine O-methyltransferase n=1 Tax=Chitinophaga niastensis TaxID=536980 RepID=A0A2P8HEU8_CHINA|nr:isoprenylcysteine carboxylmethyltransferase family protein [Chitinophaga niastensis]PSL44757.1 protein-S-isoprenylcysteine O-methyltransferase [Chitinophaga niastensis]